MTRPHLDPAAATGAPLGPVIEQLPQPIRRFGAYPDLTKLQAGDLLLVSPLKPDPVARAIQAVQAKRHGPYDAQWMHAATYLGDNSIVEIDRGGVSVNDLWKYVPTHRLLFRRPLDRNGRQVGAIEGYRIAVAALKPFKTRYSQNDLLRVLKQSLFPQTDDRISPKSPEAICSTYYDAAVARVLDRGAASAKTFPFSPADLSASVNMVDLAVGWRGLPP